MKRSHWTKALQHRALSRRSVLKGFTAVCAVSPMHALASTEAAQGTLHVLPEETGIGDGKGWDNAVSFINAGKLTAQSGPWSEVRLGVPIDDGPFRWSGEQILWNSGGRDGDPLLLVFGGVSEGQEFSEPSGTKEDPILRMKGNELFKTERPNTGGRSFITLGPESSHLSVAGPSLDRAGAKGFYRLDAKGGELRDLTFADIHVRNVGRAIECAKGTSIDGLLIERCSAHGLIRGFARFRELNNAEFRDLDLDADFLDGGGGAVCQVISVGAGGDLLFRSIRMAKAVNAIGAEERGSSYIQGDGIVLEEETRDVRIEDCHAEDMGDGGFDLKTRRVHMIGCTATRCKLGIRIWSHEEANLLERCVVTEPVKRPENDGSCLWLAGTLTAQDCTFASAGNMSPIRFGKGQNGKEDAKLTIKGGQITMSDKASFAIGSAGSIELENVLVNGTDVSGRFQWTGAELQRA